MFFVEKAILTKWKLHILTSYYNPTEIEIIDWVYSLILFASISKILFYIIFHFFRSGLHVYTIWILICLFETVSLTIWGHSNRDAPQ